MPITTKASGSTINTDSLKHLVRGLCFCIVLISLFPSCSERKTNLHTSSSHLQSTFLKDVNTTNPLIQGVWKSIGNGYYLEVQEDSILLYSYTNSSCYKEKNDYLEGLLNSQSQFIIHRDTLGIYLTDFGNKTQILQTKKDFIRVNGLPENCIGFSEMTKLSPGELFKLYMDTMQENYAFSDVRNLDWKALFEYYKDSITTDSDALFHTMGRIATLTKDQHTKVISKTGEALQYRVTPSAKVVSGAFEEQSEIEDRNTFFNAFFATNYRNISDSLLQGKGQKAANDKIEWGDLSQDIGYINILSFAGFLGNGFTRKQQIDSLNVIMKDIVATFEDKDAIIIDISFNFGGYDATALTTASYFTDVPIFSHTSQVYYNGSFYDEDKVIVHPAESKTFTKPVYVLMTDISRSAAEGFAMMMGALPNVQLVGTNTLGTLSGMLGKSIGDFYATYSNQKLIDMHGHSFEGQGVQPDIKLSVFKKEDIFQSHKNAVNDVVKLIRENKNGQ